MSRLRPSIPWIRMAPIPSGTVNINDCQVDSSALGDCSVATQSLQDSSVDSTKLADNAVSTEALQDSAVTAAELRDTSVTTAKINAAAVTFAKIQNITAQRLVGREDAITGDMQEIALSAELRFDTNNDWLEVADSGITAGLIADSTITGAKILDGTITTSDLADSAVGSNKITDSSILAIDLSDCAVESAKLGDTAVITAKINNQAVTYAKIQNVTASRLVGRIDGASAGVMQEFGVGGGLTLDTNLDLLTSDSVIAASLSFAGRVELGTAAEIDGGTDTGRALSPFYFGQSEYGHRLVQLVITDTLLATGDSQFHFFIPPELDSWDLVDADAANATPSTTGTPTIQIRNVTDAADMLSTKITIDTAEKTSYTAATPPVIDTGNDSVVTGNEIAIDIDSAGTAEGLNIILSFRHRGA